MSVKKFYKEVYCSMISLLLSFAMLMVLHPLTLILLTSLLLGKRVYTQNLMVTRE